MKIVAFCVLFVFTCCAGYAFAESAGLVYNAHEHSSKTCETAVSSMGHAITCDKLSNTLVQNQLANIAPSHAVVFLNTRMELPGWNQNKFPLLAHTAPTILRL